MISALFAKLIAILCISLIGLFAGILPAVLGIGKNCERSILLSVVLCFGCGVLLATSMVHILPDTRDALKEWAEVVFCIGFFGFYMLDLLVQYLKRGIAPAGSEEVVPVNRGTSAPVSPDEEAPLNRAENVDNGVRSYGTNEGSGTPPVVPVRRNTLASLGFGSLQTCSPTRVGILLAFTIHALLECLFIGIQNSPKSVFLLLGALSCHKVMVTFVLGAEFSSGAQNICHVIPPIMVYVFGSALGIAIGMFLHEYQADPNINLSLPIIQGIAGGTLLYIVVSDILPRERARELPDAAAFLQLFAMITGFSMLVAINSAIDF